MNTDCGCTSKNYNISLGCCVPVLAPIENYYTKHEVDKMVETLQKEIDELKEIISGDTGNG